MEAGKFLAAEIDGTYVLKLVGDVRLSLCSTIDDFLGSIFVRSKLKSILVDLTETESIDSTTLGILAKMALQAQKKFSHTPMIVSTNPSVSRVLSIMGFDRIFTICHKMPVANPDLEELQLKTNDPKKARLQVIEAHRCLMGLNEHNREQFRDLMAALESSDGAVLDG